MKNFSGKLFSALAVLSLAAACGKNSSNSGGGSEANLAPEFQEEAPLDGSNIQGHYQAKFMTLNPHVNGTIPGSANFFRKDDKLFAYVRLFAGGVKAWHMQHVYDGSRCPTPTDDTNGDGFVDIQEAEAVTGKILIPMDSDITTQTSGRRFFPLADLSGYYHYERVTSFRRFLADLMDDDNDPTDEFTKLAPGSGLRIEGKVFMVFGISETVELPDTVASKERRRAFQTLPVACGVFAKVDSIPGTQYVQDEIPGPVAEVEPGQDRPSDENIPEPTTGGSTSGTGTGSGSNDSDSGNGPTSDGNGGGRSTTGGTTGDVDTDTNSGSGTTGTTGTSGGRTSGGSTGRTSGSSSSGTSSGDGSTTGRTSGGTTSGGATTGSETTTGTTGGTTGSDDSSSTTTTGGSSSSTSSSSSSSSTTSSTTGSTTGGIFGF